MNLFARSWGGILSDAMNVRYGMRGRLWSMWVVQALEGMMCIIMGQVTIDMASPDRMLKPGSDDFVRPVYDKDPSVQPQDGMWGMWNTTNPPTGFPYTCEPPDPDLSDTALLARKLLSPLPSRRRYNTEYTFTINSTKSAWVKPCGSNSIKTPDTGVLFYGTENAIELPLPTTSNFIVVGDVMDEECVRNQGTLGVTMVVMVLFSIFVQAPLRPWPRCRLDPPPPPPPGNRPPPPPPSQRLTVRPLPPQMAEGLHFGVVPYVSAPALGVVSGMVGAGGNFGAVMGSKFIVGPPSVGPPSVDKGFINLGPRRASQRSVGSPPREARLICPGPSSPSHRRHHHGHLAPLLWDVLPGARGHALQEGRPRQLRPAALQARRRRTRR